MENSSIDEPIDAGSSESKLPLILSIVAIALGGLSFLFAFNTKSAVSRTNADLQKQVQTSVDRAEQAAADARNLGSNSEGSATLRAEFDNLKNNTDMAFKDANTAYSKIITRINAIGDRLDRIERGGQSAPAAASPSGSKSSSPQNATGTQQTAHGGKYKVERGDNPSKIANKFGVSLKDLMDANPGLKPEKLQIGQELNIPEKK